MVARNAPRAPGAPSSRFTLQAAAVSSEIASSSLTSSKQRSIVVVTKGL